MLYLCLGEIMPRGKAQDRTLLSMALVGYELEKKKIDEKIRELRTRLGQGRVSAKAAAAPDSDQPKRRKLSAAARRRIATAQRKRWAEHRKALQASKTT